MEIREEFVEPGKYYLHGLKDTHAQNVVDKFDELLKQSGVDKGAAEEAEAEVKKAKTKLDEQEKALKKLKRKSTLFLVFGIILAVVIIGIILLIKRKNDIKPLVSDAEAATAKAEKVYQEKVGISRGILAPLFALFTANIPTDLVTKTIPFITFDESFTSDKNARIVTQFKCKDDPNKDHSVTFVKTGDIADNPFMIRKYNYTHMEPEIYTGTLVVTYQVRVQTSNGTEYQTRVQTLVATHTEPKPHYDAIQSLLFWHEAAGKLSFDRTPTKLYTMDDKHKQKYIDNFEKEDAKKAQKSIKKGGNYTQLSNPKFEAYWNSENRNNEIEYRVMFTALAQTNLVHLLDQKEPFGDDFNMYKREMTNEIVSTHSQNFDYSGGTINYDADVISEVESKFKNYNINYFTNFFFDACPLLSIPVFTQNTSNPYVEGDNYGRNVPAYVCESLVNKINPSLLAHESTDTHTVFKTELVSKGKDFDNIKVHAYSYQQIPQVIMVPRVAGDGKTYLVPVHYFIYKPLEKVSAATVFKNSAIKGNNDGIIASDNGYSLSLGK